MFGIELDEDKKEHVLRKDELRCDLLFALSGTSPGVPFLTGWQSWSAPHSLAALHSLRFCFVFCCFLHSFLLISLCFLCVNVVAFCMFMLLLFHARFIIR